MVCCKPPQAFCRKGIMPTSSDPPNTFPFPVKAPEPVAGHSQESISLAFLLSEAMAVGIGGAALSSSGQVTGHTNSLGWKGFKDKQPKSKRFSLKEEVFDLPKFGGLKKEFPEVYAALKKIGDSGNYNDLEDDENETFYQSRAKKFREVVLQMTQLGLKRLGEGSSRVAFSLSPDWVLKITYGSPKQTRQEIHAASCAKAHPKFYAQIVDADMENSAWAVLEKLEQPGKVAFERWLAQSTGVGELLVQFGLEGSAPSTIFEVPPQELLHVKQPWFQEFAKAVEDCGTKTWDLDYQNWGMRKDGNWVILDYGF
jgi:hypothetical protein